MPPPTADDAAPPSSTDRGLGTPSAAGALVPAVGLTALLSVWAGFLVPFRLSGWPVPLWLLPLAAMLVIAWRAGRVAGTSGALAPALVWLALTWLAMGSRRAEGDLVVPATASGQLYLYGGLVLWAAVVLRASAHDR